MDRGAERTRSGESPSVQAVCFDLDGLMFNTEDVFEQAGVELLGRRGHRFTPEIRRQMMGRRADEAIRHLIETLKLEEDVAELRAEARSTFFELLEERLAPMPGLFELLDLIDGRGLPKAVTTSSDRPYMEQILLRFDLLARFDVTLTAEDVANGKPHPEIYLTAAARLGVPGGSMMVLEDSENGCRAAAAAGAVAVAVPSRHSRDHDFSVAHVEASGLLDPLIQRLVGTA
jgi:HAD superfamily hydrolase (TIGR01509 family)